MTSPEGPASEDNPRPDLAALPPEADPGSSQALYAALLAQVAEAMPHFRSLPDGAEEQRRLAIYCGGTPFRRELAGPEWPSMQREDIVDPIYTSNVQSFSRVVAQVAGSTHWYFGPQSRHSAESLGVIPRLWDVYYANYMRQRHMFHAQFMQALLQRSPAGSVADNFAEVEQLYAPPSPERTGEVQADFIYNRTDWLTSSVLSALTLSPDQCTAGMKRHALELYASLVSSEELRPSGDTTDVRVNSLAGFTLNAAVPRGLLRLPWSMRVSAEEINADPTPRWRSNRVIADYFGEALDFPSNDELNTFLLDRPKDYVQILLIRSYSGVDFVATIRELATLAQMPAAIKDIVFAEDASFNTVYARPEQVAALLEPAGLYELLTAQSGELDGATAQVVVALQQSGIRRLRSRGNQLAARLEEATRAAQAPPHAALFRKHGIDPGASPDQVYALTSSLKAAYARRYPRGHQTQGVRNEEEEEALKVLNAELTEIRGIADKLYGQSGTPES